MPKNHALIYAIKNRKSRSIHGQKIRQIAEFNSFFPEFVLKYSSCLMISGTKPWRFEVTKFGN